MGPKKKTGDDKGKSVAVSTRQTRSMDRLTRSQTQRRGGGGDSSSSSKLFNFEDPQPRKKRKTNAKEGGPSSKKIKIEKDDDVEAKTEEEEEEKSAAAEEDDVVVAEEDDDVAAAKEDDVVVAEKEEDESEKKKIVIEHCKQCKSFKDRANEVKAGLEQAIPGIIVTLNADKPRRGCFEIREEGGETFVSLLDMKRPFKEMKDLDMDQVIADIVEKLK